MKKFVLLMMIMVATAVVAVAASPKRYELNVNDFNVLKVNQGVNVDYRCNADSAGLVVFEADPDRTSVLMFSNDKGTLSIQLAVEDRELKGIPRVTAYSSSLSKIENGGDSTVRVLTPVSSFKFQGKLIGNGRLSIRDVRATEMSLTLATGNGIIVVGGTTSTLKINFSGTGTIQADGLKAKQIDVRATGTGAIGCDPGETLNIFGVGSTKVYYNGSPQIKDRSVGIRAIPINQAPKEE
ncbi:MAG: DUF2807 domain-containing protein [Muribaculaceae bacterium]|nr:DUF2807 domain-containing protein [Muribaculaceae bacterium]